MDRSDRPSPKWQVLGLLALFAVGLLANRLLLRPGRGSTRWVELVGRARTAPPESGHGRALELVFDLPAGVGDRIATGAKATLTAPALPGWKDTVTVPSLSGHAQGSLMRLHLGNPPERLVHGMTVDARLRLAARRRSSP